jgi:hypothetical protein
MWGVKKKEKPIVTHKDCSECGHSVRLGYLVERETGFPWLRYVCRECHFKTHNRCECGVGWIMKKVRKTKKIKKKK